MLRRCGSKPSCYLPVFSTTYASFLYHGMGKRVKAKTHLTHTHLDLDKDVGEIMIAVRQSNDGRDLQAMELLLSPHSCQR